MKIEVHLLSQSQPMTYEDVKNAYTKDGMYCMLLEDGEVTKFPMVNIFRVKEFDEEFIHIKKEVVHELDDLKLSGELVVCNKELILIPRDMFEDVLELNDIQLHESEVGEMNMVIGNRAIIHCVD